MEYKKPKNTFFRLSALLMFTFGAIFFAQTVFSQSASNLDSEQDGVYCPNLSLPLKRGYRDANTQGQVSELQNFLVDFYDLEPTQLLTTGIFGTITQGYVKRFQSENNLIVTGIVGLPTRTKILSVCTIPQTNQSTGTTTILRQTSTSTVNALSCPVLPIPYCSGTLNPMYINGCPFYSCTGSTGSTTNAICTALNPETRTSTPCPTGQTGLITEVRTSSCSQGASSPTWSNWITVTNTCSVPATTTPSNLSCTFNGQTIQSGNTVTAYQSSSVTSPATCQSEVRSCTNGTLSGSYTAASCSVTTPVTNIPIDVFLVAGQSNAAGVGDASGSPIPQTGTVLQVTPTSISDAKDPVLGANTGSAWPQFGITYYNTSGKKVAFVLSALGGTAQSVYGDTGLGNWDTSGTLLPTAISNLNGAMTKLTNSGYTPTFKGVLWSQGEADAFAINAGSMTVGTYQAAFINMLSRMRSSLGASMPFYIFKTGTQTNGSDVGYAQVRQAQENVATLANNYIAWRGAVDFPARGLMKDVWHYTQSGYNEMGQLGALAVLGTQPPAPLNSNTVVKSFTTPGTYTFTVPSSFASLSVTVKGGGGPGIGCIGVYAAASPLYGSAGGRSSFNDNVIANGGAADGSTPGTASGGDTNSNGGAGNASQTTSYPGCDGLTHTGITSHGGLATKSYTQSTLNPGSTVNVVVGAGGLGGLGGTFNATSGGNGSVVITYTQ